MPLLDEAFKRYHYDPLFHAKVQMILFGLREETGMLLDVAETELAIRYIGATLLMVEKAKELKL